MPRTREAASRSTATATCRSMRTANRRRGSGGCRRGSYMRGHRRLAGEPVGAPLLAPDAVVNEEQPLRIVTALDRAQTRGVLAPVRPAPCGVEVLAPLAG